MTSPGRAGARVGDLALEMAAERALHDGLVRARSSSRGAARGGRRVRSARRASAVTMSHAKPIAEDRARRARGHSSRCAAARAAPVYVSEQTTQRMPLWRLAAIDMPTPVPQTDPAIQLSPRGRRARPRARSRGSPCSRSEVVPRSSTVDARAFDGAAAASSVLSAEPPVVGGDARRARAQPLEPRRRRASSSFRRSRTSCSARA